MGWWSVERALRRDITEAEDARDTAIRERDAARKTAEEIAGERDWAIEERDEARQIAAHLLQRHADTAENSNRVIKAAVGAALWLKPETEPT